MTDLTFTGRQKLHCFTYKDNIRYGLLMGNGCMFAMTYNGGTSTYVFYQDDQPMLNKTSAYGDLTSSSFFGRPGRSNSRFCHPRGNINWAGPPP